MAAYQYGTDLAIYDAMLKEWYTDDYVDMLASGTTSWKEFSRKKVNWKGREMVIPLRIGRNSSPQWAAMSAYMPNAPGAGVAQTAVGTAGGGPASLSIPGFQRTIDAFVQPRMFTFSLQLAQDAVDRAKGDRGAMVDLLDFEMSNLQKDAQERLDQDVYGDGSGHLPFHVQYALNATTSITKSIITATGVATGTLTVNGSHSWYLGQRVRFFASDWSAVHGEGAGGITLGYGVISAIDNSADNGTCNITVAASDTPGAAGCNLTAGVSVAATDHIVSYGSKTATGVDAGNNQMHGLCAAISDTKPGGAYTTDITAPSNMFETYYMGINRATASNSFFRSYMDRITAPNASQYDWMDPTAGNPYWVLQKMVDRIHNTSRGKIDKMFTCREVTRAFSSMALGGPPSSSGYYPGYSKQHFVNTMKTQKGFLAEKQDERGASDWVMFNNSIPMVVDRYAGPWWDGTYTCGTIWAVDSSTFYMAIVKELGWLNVGGSIFKQTVDTNGNYTLGVVANSYMIGDLVCDAPNRNGCVTRVLLS